MKEEIFSTRTPLFSFDSKRNKCKKKSWSVSKPTWFSFVLSQMGGIDLVYRGSGYQERGRKPNCHHSLWKVCGGRFLVQKLNWERHSGSPTMPFKRWESYGAWKKRYFPQELLSSSSTLREKNAKRNLDRHPNQHDSLSFLINWKELTWAAENLVIGREYEGQAVTITCEKYVVANSWSKNWTG